MPPFEPYRITRSASMRLAAPAGEVFPLVCPVREKEWLDGWEYEMIYSESGYAEEGCIFTTQHPGQPETIWTITRHDPEALAVDFLIVTPGLRVGRLQVRLSDNGDGTTRQAVTYTFTALSEQGKATLDDHFSQRGFEHDMHLWERSVNHYLETGQMFRLPGGLHH